MCVGFRCQKLEDCMAVIVLTKFVWRMFLNRYLECAEINVRTFEAENLESGHAQLLALEMVLLALPYVLGAFNLSVGCFLDLRYD